MNRSHCKNIIDADYSNSMDAIITASLDSTVKIWTGKSLSQFGQFDFK